MESDEYDAAMRLSHEAGIARVGGEVGTPITHIDGVGRLWPGPERDPARRRRHPGFRRRAAARRLPAVL